MADRPLLIIHGWSGSAESFRPLAKILGARLGQTVQVIDLGQYESMDDEVTFDDIVTAMSRAWQQKGLPTEPYSVDVLIHSTGGLVIRDWLDRNFSDTLSPIKHLVMLAPANFGSPLAHKGRSFIGRIVKGWDSAKPFQTGEKILKGLELASPYSWDLAMRDRFSPKDYYGPGKTLCTVLVGNTGYSGIRAAANEDGADGTVRVSTANMNCAYWEMDFHTDPKNPTSTFQPSKGMVAFGILDGEDHSSITFKDRKPKDNDPTLKAFLDALTVADSGFEAWCDAWTKSNADLMEKGARRREKHGFQNTVFLVQDQFGNPVHDYFLEFFIDDDEKDRFAEFFHGDAIASVHAYGDNPAYRSVYVDCTLLRKQIDKEDEDIRISLSASPDIGRNNIVGFRSLSDNDIGSIKIKKNDLDRAFQDNRTLLVRIVLKREQSEKVFEILDST